MSITGWICPKCQRVYGPAAQDCPRCNAGTDILPWVTPTRFTGHKCLMCGQFHPEGLPCPAMSPIALAAKEKR